MLDALITSALSAIAGSAGAKAAGKDLSVATWNTIKPYLIVEDDPEKEKVAEAAAEVRGDDEPSPAAVAMVRQRLEDALTGQPDRIEALQKVLSSRDFNVQFNNPDNAGTIKQVGKINTGGGDVNF